MTRKKKNNDDHTAKPELATKLSTGPINTACPTSKAVVRARDTGLHPILIHQVANSRSFLLPASIHLSTQPGWSSDLFQSPNSVLEVHVKPSSSTLRTTSFPLFSLRSWPSGSRACLPSSSSPPPAADTPCTVSSAHGVNSAKAVPFSRHYSAATVGTNLSQCSFKQNVFEFFHFSNNIQRTASTSFLTIQN